MPTHPAAPSGRDQPVLELLSALPAFEEDALPNVPLDLRLGRGDCALIETYDPERATAFADLCSGMIGLRHGVVRCMGFDWTELGWERACALRGRIGRIHGKAAWIGMLRTHIDIMLPQLHHTREPEFAIVQSANALASRLGLPGLPLVRPDRLSEGDLMRAACVRAFLGEPRLLLLENPVSAEHAELIDPLLDLLSQALDRGAAAICFTRDVPLWQAQNFPTTHRLHLLEDGLSPRRGR